MQPVSETDTQPILQKLKTATAILAWSAGLILAGSEGTPYVNLAGALLFSLSCVCLARRAGKPARKASDPVAISPKRAPRQAQRFTPRVRQRLAPNRLKSGAIRPRYARELGVV